MINLIENELKKVFKKKTIYILLIIIVGYILLVNVITRVTDNGYQNYYYYDGDIEYYEHHLSSLDPNSTSEKSEYLDIKCQLELAKLTQKYGNNSWQAYVINNILIEDINTIVNHEYSGSITEEEFSTAKQNYDMAISKFETNDWKYFVEQDLSKINLLLKNQNKLKQSVQDKQELNSINDTIYDLELQKQINEWRLEKNISYAPSFLNTALQTYYNNQLSLHGYENTNIDSLSSEELQYYRHVLEEANLNKYYIENNITLDSNSRDIFINLFGNYELFILIVGIVIAGSIVSEEFSRGTIKLLLVKPYNRLKILLAKFIVCILVLCITIAFIYTFQLVVGGIINGFEGLSLPAIVYNFDTNRVQTINLLAYVALIGLCKLPIYILLSTLAFACSTLFTNTALAVSVPFLGYIGSSIINQLALMYDFKQIVYFVTPNWDLTYYLFGGLPLFKGTTLPFSILICLVYLLIMVVVSCIVFKKRDIKNI